MSMDRKYQVTTNEQINFYRARDFCLLPLNDLKEKITLLAAQYLDFIDRITYAVGLQKCSRLHVCSAYESWKNTHLLSIVVTLKSKMTFYA